MQFYLGPSKDEDVRNRKYTSVKVSSRVGGELRPW